MSPRTIANDAKLDPTGRTSATGSAVGRSFCGSPGRTGSPFLVSGELFLRSTPQLFQRSKKVTSTISTVVPTVDNNRPSRRYSTANLRSDYKAMAIADRTRCASVSLLGEVSTDFRHLLLCHPNPYKCGGSEKEEGEHVIGGQGRGNTFSSTEVASQARKEHMFARTERIKQLEASKAMVDCIVATRLGVMERAAATFRASCNDCRTRLDERLGSLILRYAAAMKAEMADEDAQTAAEGEHCKREQERLGFSAKLASLAATAEHRTRRGVMLRRLPPEHPQHARCLRAATENVKAGFFSTNGPPYGAIRVLDVYKLLSIDRKWLDYGSWSRKRLRGSR